MDNTLVKDEEKNKTGHGISNLVNFVLNKEKDKMSSLINKALTQTKSKLSNISKNYQNSLFPRFQVFYFLDFINPSHKGNHIKW